MSRLSDAMSGYGRLAYGIADGAYLLRPEQLMDAYSPDKAGHVLSWLMKEHLPAARIMPYIIWRRSSYSVRAECYGARLPHIDESEVHNRSQLTWARRSYTSPIVNLSCTTGESTAENYTSRTGRDVEFPRSGARGASIFVSSRRYVQCFRNELCILDEALAFAKKLPLQT